MVLPREYGIKSAQSCCFPRIDKVEQMTNINVDKSGPTTDSYGTPCFNSCATTLSDFLLPFI